MIFTKPLVDVNDMAKWIGKRIRVDDEMVLRILDAELDYLAVKGIAIKKEG